jgi:peptidoglycan-associated lipoprotein
MTIHFQTGTAAVPTAALGEIERRAALAAEEGALVVVEGHSDARGEELHNLLLSRRRADAVARRLRAAGIPSKRIVVRSFGSQRPAAEGSDARALELNRRVEILIERGRS